MDNSTPLPESYSSLPFEEISISHVPESSPTPTSVVLLKLNRPQKYNAATERMIEELVLAYEYFNSDDRIKAIVVTGAGKAFCVGADLEMGFSKIRKTLNGGHVKRNAYRDGGGRVTLAIHNCRKPTIVAINGPAAGFGITLTLPATIRVACASAKISFAFSQRGLVMEAASAYFLPRLVGMSRALHVVTTGAVYEASDPLLAQLFSQILPTPEETVARALEIAGEISRRTSVVNTTVMHDLMYRGPSTPEEAHLLDSKVFLSMLELKDSEEGMMSFVQKREPDFKGTMRVDPPLEWPWWTPVSTIPQDGSAGSKPSKL